MAKKQPTHPGLKYLKKIEALAERASRGEKVTADELIKFQSEVTSDTAGQKHINGGCPECQQAIMKIYVIINSRGWA